MGPSRAGGRGGRGGAPRCSNPGRAPRAPSRPAGATEGDFHRDTPRTRPWLRCEAGEGRRGLGVGGWDGGWGGEGRGTPKMPGRSGRRVRAGTAWAWDCARQGAVRAKGASWNRGPARLGGGGGRAGPGSCGNPGGAGAEGSPLCSRPRWVPCRGRDRGRGGEGWRGLGRLPRRVALTGMDGRPAAHSARR